MHPQIIVAFQLVTSGAVINGHVKARAQQIPTRDIKIPLERGFLANNLKTKSLHAEKNKHAKAKIIAIKNFLKLSTNIPNYLRCPRCGL